MTNDKFCQQNVILMGFGPHQQGTAEIINHKTCIRHYVFAASSSYLSTTSNVGPKGFPLKYKPFHQVVPGGLGWYSTLPLWTEPEQPYCAITVW